MSSLTTQEINEIFINANLEGEYNFLQEDLIKLANAFIDAAKGPAAKAERKECLKVVRSLNTAVADKLEEVRGKL
jgi:hypothetical protein